MESKMAFFLWLTCATAWKTGRHDSKNASQDETFKITLALRIQTRIDFSKKSHPFSVIGIVGEIPDSYGISKNFLGSGKVT